MSMVRLPEILDETAEVTARRQVIDIFLQPGEVYFGDADTCIRTVLGSCVAVTLWHPRRRIGGMCHFMLPERGQSPAGAALDGRYGDEALELLLREVRHHHSRPADYQVKVFGGGNMFPNATNLTHVGRRNHEFALEHLAALGLTVGKRHLAGHGHRQVIFEVWSGDVWLRHAPVLTEES